ncbi:uncharacterized protein LOC141891988 isoform X2 [Acropora palmata]|uniref:uncharacterized protein LOC141891988 isoform X2 n=1 Tax=Acropora palmata TaxID=6131 RepID=UPI003D9FC5AC
MKQCWKWELKTAKLGTSNTRIARGLPYGLTEGDILCVFSQYGEIVNINLVRDKKTGKTKGFCFLCYEDQRSTILAVDNFNGIKLGGRTIRVDHCANYRRPKSDEKDEHGNYKEIIEEGCAPKSPPQVDDEEDDVEISKKRKKEKKQKQSKEKSENKKRKKTRSSEEEDKQEKLNFKRREGSHKNMEEKERDKNARSEQNAVDEYKLWKHEGRLDNGSDYRKTVKGERHVYKSRGESEHKYRDDEYKHKQDSHDSIQSYGGNGRHMANEFRERTRNVHCTSHNERGVSPHERRTERSNKRESRENERRSHKRQGNRSPHFDCRER